MSNRKAEALPQKQNRQIKRRVILNQNKGLNNLVSPSLIDDREFSQLENVEYDEGGVLRKRSGYSQVNGSLTAAKGLGTFVNETYRQQVTIDGGTLKYTSTGSWTSDNTVTFSSTAIPDFNQVRDKLYIWDGVNGGAEWTGAALSRPGTMPRAKFSLFYDGYHICSGVSGQPNRLYISDVEDASAFTVAAAPPTLDNATEVPGATVFAGTDAQFIDIAPNDGDEIRGLSKFQDVILVFKERSIFQLNFDDTGNPVVQLITNATGCVGHKSIDTVENDVYFLSREGVRVIGNEPNFFTSIRTNRLSIRIEPTVSSINPAYFSDCVAIYDDNKYILSVPTSNSTTADTAIVYDRRFQAWTVWKSFNSTGFIRWVDADNEESLRFMDADGTMTEEVTPGTYNDNGAAIVAFVVSKAWDAKNPDITKVWPDIGLMFRRVTGRVDITIYEDSGITAGTTTLVQGTADGMGLQALGTQVLGLGTGQTSDDSIFTDDPIRVVLNMTSKSIKFKLYNDRVDENFVFLGTIYAYYPYTHFLFDSSKKLYI